jgi:NAD(P)H-dependent FMN reductase
MEGVNTVPWNSHTVAHLRAVEKHDEFADTFRDAEIVMLAFPLYTDAMPGIVKAFIEKLAPLVDRPQNPPVLFLVQSGFPEAHHSRFVERYLEKLARRLGSRYVGTMVRGNCEGIHMMPAWMTKAVRTTITRLGAHFAKTGEFDPDLLRQFARPEHLTRVGRAVVRLMGVVGMANFHWNSQLAKHKAYAKRFARPHEGLW